MLTRRAFAGLLATGVVAPLLPARALAGVDAGAHPRSDWQAAPARSGGRPHVPTRLALHHTAGPQAGRDRAAATLRSIQAFHMKDKGWVDIAYHLFVDADGGVWEGRSPDIAGDTATTYDPAGWFLVCALGNFEEVRPTAAQIEGIAAALAAVSTARAIPLDTLTPHRDLAATLCPGKHLAALVADGSLRERAEALLSPR